MKKLIILCLLAFPILTQADVTSSTIPTITLSAQGTLHKPADELQMNIGVITFKDTANEALLENSQKMDAIIESLTAAGLTIKDYETGHFSISPTYTTYPKNPPPDWKQSINGYEVSNSIFIHTSLIDSAGKIIDAANQAGANNINAISFVLHDQRIYWNEAISLAVENAIIDAQTIAKAANLKLVRILSIALDGNHNVSPRGGFSGKLANYSSAPAIEAGDVAITANVTITYEIAPN